MANVAPATVTITSSIGAGQAVTAAKFTDVQDIEVDFVKNTIKLTRGGGSAAPIISYYDFSVIATITWTIGSGLSTLAFS